MSTLQASRDARCTYDALNSYGYGHSEIMRALERAERNGVAPLRNGVTITHTGYQDGTREFHAATALYSVRY